VNALARRVHRIVTGDRRWKWLLTPLGGGFYYSVIGGLVWLAMRVDQWLGLPRYPGTSVNYLMGVPIAAFGLFLIGWTVGIFFNAKGTPVPFNPPPRLITTGPYARSRNPMISGVLLLVLGFGLMLRSLTTVALLTPFLFLLHYIGIKLVEEPELDLRFGDAYREYRGKVGMFG